MHDSVRVRPSGWRRLPMILLLLSLLGACSSPEPPIRVATLPWPPYDLIHLADQLDRLDRKKVQLVEFQTPAEVVRAYRYDLVDVMLVTSHFALSTIAERPDTRIIYFIDVSLGGDALLTRADIESPEQLRGRRIGIEAAPLGTYTLIRALQHLELDRDDVSIVEVDTPDQGEAFLSGSIDAVVTYDPTRTMLLEQGANQLFGSEQIPYEIVDVVVARDAVVETRPDALVELIRGVGEGLERFRQQPAVHARELARRHGVTADAYLGTLQAVELFDLDANRAIFDDPDGPVWSGLQNQCEIMTREGLLIREPSLEPLLDRRIVDRAGRR
jgi:NitT/TauT family transport system substrate-binding protein